MRKSTHYFYDQTDVRKIIADELKKTKPDWVEKITRKVTESVAKFKDEILTVLDKVIGELKTIREEQIIMSGRQSEHSDTIEDHDTRLKKLESHAGFATG